MRTVGYRIQALYAECHYAECCYTEHHYTFRKATHKMRTTFSEMHLFNDTRFEQETSFICNRKEQGVGKREGERERKRKSEIQSAGGKGCSVCHKLDCWSSIYEGQETG